MQIDQLNLRILISTRKFLIYTIVLCIVGFILITAVLIPQIQESLATYSKLSSEQPKTEILRKKRASLESLTSTAEFAQIDVVDKALPTKKPLLELLMSMSTISQQTGSRITKFELAPGLVASSTDGLQQPGRTNTNGYDSVSVNLEISGSFAQIQAFLLQVEEVAPFTTVTDMEISGQLADVSQRDNSQIFNAKLTTETYFFTQSIAVRVESPLPLLGTPEQNVLAALASFAPTDLPEQLEVKGGGSEDLFNLNEIKTSEQLESLLQARSGGLGVTGTTSTGSTNTGLGTTTPTGSVRGASTEVPALE
jgi:Tfp pilus assembly protein PilO